MSEEISPLQSATDNLFRMAEGLESEPATDPLALKGPNLAEMLIDKNSPEADSVNTALSKCRKALSSF